MQVLPINKYSIKSENQQKQNATSNLNFNGKVGRSVYSHVKEVKRELGNRALKYGEDNSKRLQSVDVALQALEDFAKKLHSKTRIRMFASNVFNRGWNNREVNGRIMYSTAFVQDSCKLFDSSKLIEVPDIAHETYYEHNFVNTVNELLEHCTPEGRNAKIFYDSRKNKIDDYINNMENTSYNFIERFVLRQRAKRFDKLAPEFNAESDALKMVNDRFKEIDRVNDLVKNRHLPVYDINAGKILDKEGNPIEDIRLEDKLTLKFLKKIANQKNPKCREEYIANLKRKMKQMNSLDREKVQSAIEIAQSKLS